MEVIWVQPRRLARRLQHLLPITSDATDANVTNTAGKVDFSALYHANPHSNEALNVELSEIRRNI
jgi:hypothetical protein